MASEPCTLSQREQHLEGIVLSYLHAVDAGQTPEPRELLARHPDLKEELTAFFADQEKLAPLLTPLRVIPPVPFLAATPSRIGDYEVLEEIARGGMGVVFKARQVSLNRVVALKMIRDRHLADADEVRRFRTEAENAARLDHPHIVPIYEVGEWRPQDSSPPIPYFSMKLIAGGSLAHVIADCRLQIADFQKRAARLLAQVARAVHHAHQHGILHRDLKPANILLQLPDDSLQSAICNLQSAIPMITDFGLAKRIEGDGQQTRSGAIVGTAEYMAPEQARAQKRLSTAADVYSLGAILYELLTGRVPFRGDNVLETLRQVIDCDPLPPRTLNPRVDRDLETICLKCLAKEPARRYGSAEALADDLERWLAHEPITARPVGAAERVVKWAKRRPAVTGLLTAVALLTLGGIVGTFSQYQDARAEAQRKGVALGQAEKAEREARQRAEEERQARLAEAKAKEDAHQKEKWALQELHRARCSLMNMQLLRVAALHERDPQAAQELLDDTRTCPLDLRDFTWGLYYRWCQRQRLTLGAWNTLLDTDGKTLVLGDGEGVKLWDVNSGKERTAFRVRNLFATHVALATDGQVVAVAYSDATVRLWDVAAGKERVVLKQPGRRTAPALTRDGRTLALGCEDKTVRLWDLTTGKEQAILLGHKASITQVRFSADGKTLISLSHDGVVKSWDPIAGKERASFHGGPHSLFLSYGDPNMLAFLDGGKVVALVCEDSTIKLWDTATGKELRTLRGHSKPVLSLAVRGEDTLLASGSEDGTVKLWDTATGQAQGTLQGHQAAVTSLAFATDGRTLASGGKDGTVKLWDARSGRERTTMKGHGWTVDFLAFSADGRTLISNSAGEVKLWEVFPDRPHSTLRGHTNFVSSVAYGPDGKLMATGSHDHTVKLWDATTGQERGTLRGHTDTVAGVAFSPDGQTLATASYDHTVSVWDLATSKEWITLKGHTGKVTSVAFSADSRTLASGSEDHTVKLWDLATGKERATLKGHADEVHAVAFRADGKVLASASADETVRLWDVATGKELHTLRGHSGAVQALAFHPDGLILASGSGGRDSQERWFGELKLWDVAAGEEQATVKGHGNFIASLAFSADGKTLASGSWDQTVQLWDAVTGQERATLKGATGAVLAVAFSPDSKTLAGGSGGKDRQDHWFGEVQRWTLSPQPELATLKGHTAQVNSLTFTTDGKTLVSASSPEVKLWDATTGRERAQFRHPGGYLMACSPDGQILALRGRVFDAKKEQWTDKVKLWDLTTDKERAALKGQQAEVTCLTFSADGKTLVIGGSTMDPTRIGPDNEPERRGEVKLWDVTTGQERASFRAETSAITAVALSPDGKTVVAGTTNKGLLFWDMVTGEQRSPFKGDWSPVAIVAFSPDGKVLGMNLGGAVYLVDAATGKLQTTLHGERRGGFHSLVFSPDGKFLAAVRDSERNASSTVILWNVATGNARATLPHAHRVGAVAFSADGRRLATGSGDLRYGEVKLWNVPLAEAPRP